MNLDGKDDAKALYNFDGLETLDNIEKNVTDETGNPILKVNVSIKFKPSFDFSNFPISTLTKLMGGLGREIMQTILAGLKSNKNEDKDVN